MSPRSFKLLCQTVLTLGVALGSHAAPAHHSFAMFDANQTLTATGTVKDFQWGNPHVWLDIVVLHPDGTRKSLSLELTGISGLVRAGWKPVTLKPAETVKVTYHPLRDGSPGGQLIQVVTANGTVLKGQ
jgi:hypothetical protein